jgi:hypothetical protein
MKEKVEGEIEVNKSEMNHFPLVGAHFWDALGIKWSAFSIPPTSVSLNHPKRRGTGAFHRQACACVFWRRRLLPISKQTAIHSPQSPLFGGPQGATCVCSTSIDGVAFLASSVHFGALKGRELPEGSDLRWFRLGKRSEQRLGNPEMHRVRRLAALIRRQPLPQRFLIQVHHHADEIGSKHAF